MQKKCNYALHSVIKRKKRKKKRTNTATENLPREKKETEHFLITAFRTHCTTMIVRFASTARKGCVCTIFFFFLFYNFTDRNYSFRRNRLSLFTNQSILQSNKNNNFFLLIHNTTNIFALCKFMRKHKSLFRFIDILHIWFYFWFFFFVCVEKIDIKP